MVADIEGAGNFGRIGNSYWETQCKGSHHAPKNSEHFTFFVADVTVKLSGRDQVFQRSTSIRDHPARGEDHNDVLQGESDVSQPSDTLQRKKHQAQLERQVHGRTSFAASGRCGKGAKPDMM